MAVSTDQRLRITYLVRCSGDENPEEKVGDIAYEQTVELPRGCAPAPIEERYPGRVEALDEEPDGRYRARISYDVAVLDHGLPQLLNVVFGNISMQTGIQVVHVEWPLQHMPGAPGPAFGVEGIRRIAQAPEGRPLICAALKPMGLTPRELADRCHALAAGGADVIKDDHGLCNQAPSPLADRVGVCQEAVARANAETGHHCAYFPNVTGRFGEIPSYVELVQKAGCQGVLVCPMIVGIDVMVWLAETSGLAVLAHPALTGMFFAPEHGILPEIFYGQLLRLAGADGVIYTNAGGRFPFSEETCVGINERLLEPLGDRRPAFPVPGGGINVARVTHWLERYGPDTMFLIGGSFYMQPDLRGGVAALRERIDRYVSEREAASES